MHEQLAGKIKGASVAILGAGPTITQYKGKEDITIAANGACLIDKPIDYFIAGDKNAPRRPWWRHSLDQHSIRLISAYIAPYDPKLYPDKEIRWEEQQRLEKNYTKNIILDEKSPNLLQENAYVYFEPNHPTAKPHQYFRFGGFADQESNLADPTRKAPLWGGTITSIAIQIANTLGARTIHLYGCGFNNPDGKKYHYTCAEQHKGMITTQQRKIMQKTIDDTRARGIEVIIHGTSTLQ